MGRSVYVAIPLMFLLAVVQTAVLPHFQLLNLSPILPLLFAMAWALLHRAEDGLMWAFIGGLFLDLFSITYVGISSLTFVVSVTAVLLFAATFPEGDYLTMLAMSVFGTFIYALTYGLLLRLWGQSDSFNLILTLLPLILLHAIFCLPVYWLLKVTEQIFGNSKK